MCKRVIVVGNTTSPMLAGFDGADFEILHMDSDESTVDAIIARARTERADGILASDRTTLLAVSEAAAEIGLPGLSVDCAKTLLDRSALRECLARNDVRQPEYTLLEQGRNVSAEWIAAGPVYVVALDSFTGDNERKVDHPEDVPLGTIQVRKRSTAEQVIVEQSLSGSPISVYGYVVSKRFTALAFFDQEWLLGFRFPRSLVYPANLDSESENAIIKIIQRALDAVGFDHGSVRIDMLVSDDQTYILDIDPCTLSAWLPVDLPALANGPSIIATALAVATGVAPVAKDRRRAAAIAWIPTRSGHVEGVDGEDVAKSMPGVKSVRVVAREGDVFAHTIDIPSRDRVGYVLALGEDAPEALRRAEEARDAIRVNTLNVLPTRGR